MESVSLPDEPAASGDRSPSSVPFKDALRFWLVLGFVSFGGPAGQIAIMHRELVEERRWISEKRFVHALQYCMLLPGPEAQQLATYIGWMLHRTLGGLVAGCLFVLPSVFILLGLSIVYARHGDVGWMAAALGGVKPMVVAIVLDALLRVGRRTVRGVAQLLVAAGAFVALSLLGVPYPFVVAGAALAGLVHHAARRGRGNASTRDASLATPESPAESVPGYVIGDDDAPPPHTRASRRRTVRIALLGATLWVLPLLGLTAWRGGPGVFIEEYLFFTQAALVTFGGAYAVLAYITEAATGPYGWITPAQAVDGLALAETTPGPLIMVVQFVGFLAAWNDPGALSPLTSGVLGAFVTTYVTFLPSLLLVFLGAPFVERLRGNRRLAAALEGVTAAVVGAILHLAVLFGTTVLWPEGWGWPEPFAAVSAIAGFIVLRAGKANVVTLVLAGAAAGLVRTVLT